MRTKSGDSFMTTDYQYLISNKHFILCVYGRLNVRFIFPEVHPIDVNRFSVAGVRSGFTMGKI